MSNSQQASPKPLSLWLSRHPALFVLVLAYLLAWALWLPLLGRNLGQEAALGPDFLILALLGGFMPSLVALLWYALGGRADPRAQADLVRPRRLWPWLLLGLVATPVLTLGGIALELLAGRPFGLGDIGSRLVIGLVWPLCAACGEEFAWRGRVLPALRGRFGLLGAALIVGVLWGFWHLPADWIGLKAQGDWFWPQFLVQGPLLLGAHSVIITWLWAKTGGRTLVAILYHFGITASAIILGNQLPGQEGASSFIGNLCLSAVVLVAALLAGLGLMRRDRAAK